MEPYITPPYTPKTEHSGFRSASGHGGNRFHLHRHLAARPQRRGRPYNVAIINRVNAHS